MDQTAMSYHTTDRLAYANYEGDIRYSYGCSWFNGM